MEKKIHIIKKYPNRRLYDTTRAKYITLEDIKQFVLDHVEFQVIDSRTEKDITQATLMQIILEQENTNDPIFTTKMLQDFIRFYHEKSQTILSQYLEQMMGLFTQQKEFIKNQWETSQKLFTDPSFLTEFMKLQKNWYEAQQKPSPNDPKKPSSKNKT